MRLWISSAMVALVGLLELDAHGAEVKLQRFRWMPQSWKPFSLYLPLQVGDQTVNAGLLRKQSQILDTGSEFVGRSAQYIAGAKLEGSYLQTVFDRSGQALYSSGSIVDNIPDNLVNEVRELQYNVALVPWYLRGLYPAFGEARMVSAPIVEIVLKDNLLTPVWVVYFLTRDESEAKRARVLKGGALLDLQTVGSDFIDGSGSVYPEGPKRGDINNVTLANLSGDGSLIGKKASVSSVQSDTVFEPSLIFQFSPADRRFDLVQVYYYVDRAMQWFKDNLGAELQDSVQARVYAGDNGGTSNRAYYYNKSIFLGAGDGVIYKNLMRDPSVVFHEAAHAIIDAYAGLPTDGEGGSFNEGFADLFAALALDNPNMGEVSYLAAPFRRTLNNSLKAGVDFKPGVYQNGTIIGGTFWDMRDRLGSERTAQLAFRTLVRLGAGAQFKDFLPALVNACSSYCSADEVTVVQEILTKRGWRQLPHAF